jgi:hypothetical protein
MQCNAKALVLACCHLRPPHPLTSLEWGLWFTCISTCLQNQIFDVVDGGSGYINLLETASGYGR